MKDLTVEQYRAFVQDLEALTKKHGIYIHGCGCCGSPSMGQVSADQKEHFYSFEECGDCISFVDHKEYLNKISYSDREFHKVTRT